MPLQVMGLNLNLSKQLVTLLLAGALVPLRKKIPVPTCFFMADWEKAIGDTSWIQEEIPDITGLSGFIPAGNKNELAEIIEEEVSMILEKEEREEEEKEIEPEATETTEKNNTDSVTGQDKSAIGPLWRNIIIVIVLLVIAVPTVSYFLKRK